MELDCPQKLHLISSDYGSPSVRSLKTIMINVRPAHKTMKIRHLESTIRSEEGKFFLHIMQSLFQDSGALHNPDLETTHCGLCELIALGI